ncbi:YggS family pyridoxal phosphate-dependent enzyme [archaeon]|nr:MAG: YggS family pyridoxal phosphate-dependent enzyme [archaeon]
MGIRENIEKIRDSLPRSVVIQAAAKTRTADEVREAIDAGITTFGQNYLQEAIPVIEEIGHDVRWHYIGRIQKNKINKLIEHFGMIETVDSLATAQHIDKRAEAKDVVMPILLEVNSGNEEQKEGVLPEGALQLAREVSELEHVTLRGLMTMGPFVEDPEDARPYFSITRKLFDTICRKPMLSDDACVLSMGMSNTYRVAVEEGATMVRIGEAIFGKRTR